MLNKDESLKDALPEKVSLKLTDNLKSSDTSAYNNHTVHTIGTSLVQQREMGRCIEIESAVNPLLLLH